MTLLTPPEGDSHIALVDLKGEGRRRRGGRGLGRLPARREVAAQGHERLARQGRLVEHPQTTPTRRRRTRSATSASTRARAGDIWTVVDLRHGAGRRREARRAGRAHLRAGSCPKGYERESLRGQEGATSSTRARIAELSAVRRGRAQKALGVPGVAVGIVQDGKVVFAGGFGVRELGGTRRPTPTPLYMIASNTKALTTLMLAKLVDEKKLTWDTPVDEAAAVVQARRCRHDVAGCW